MVEAGSGGGMLYGFVVQGSIFANGRTTGGAEAVFVGTGTNRMVNARDGAFEPAVGDELILRGRSADLRGRPGMLDPYVLRLVRRGVDLEHEVPPFEANPPEGAEDAARYWAAHHAMRCRLPAGCLVQGTHVGESPGQLSLVTVIRPDHPLAARTDPYQRRVFRDAHPLDDRPGEFADNGNGFRITLADGAIAAASDAAAMRLPPLRTFDRITSSITGVVLRSGELYAVHLESPLAFERGVPPDLNGAALVRRTRAQLSVATFNLENLYDFRDDPFDEQDFFEPLAPGQDPAMRRLQNYVPSSGEAYVRRLRGLAAQMVQDLECPDVMLVQEVEDQDIGSMLDGTLQVGTVNNRDGRLDVLQELAAEIVRLGGPLYASAADRAGADERGIVCAMLYRTDRVRLSVVERGHPVLSAEPHTAYVGATLAYRYETANPRAVNGLHSEFGVVHKRAVEVACFERAPGTDLALPQGQRLYVLANHFQSQPGAHVGLRIEQARLAGAVAAAIAQYEPHAWIVVGGDLNTFPRPDEPVPGTPADQLGALYDAGLANLYDTQLLRQPAGAYTYVYQGEAGTLDHLFVSTNLLAHLVSVNPLHINADYSPDPRIANRRCSDHDPVLAVFEGGE
ncbi:MAG: endonuclease/exonuclease/phosphatase family protein [Lentisphaerae bacterium]|nr:endonuclease/exonuclease/phosphatase family protein [Lentisphaerota bacterium]